MSARHDDGLGGSITILEHGSETAPMRFRMVMPKGMGPPAPECHPSQTEDFTVLRGTLDLGVVDGRRVVLKTGETFRLPAGVFHLPACGADGEVEFEGVLTPGLESGDMFTELYTVMREHRGVGQFARVSMVFLRHARAIEFKAPVRAAMKVAAAIAGLLGVTLPAAAPRVIAGPSRAS